MQQPLGNVKDQLHLAQMNNDSNDFSTWFQQQSNNYFRVIWLFNYVEIWALIKPPRVSTFNG